MSLVQQSQLLRQRFIQHALTADTALGSIFVQIILTYTQNLYTVNINGCVRQFTDNLHRQRNGDRLTRQSLQILSHLGILEGPVIQEVDKGRAVCHALCRNGGCEFIGLIALIIFDIGSCQLAKLHILNGNIGSTGIISVDLHSSAGGQILAAVAFGNSLISFRIGFRGACKIVGIVIKQLVGSRKRKLLAALSAFSVLAGIVLAGIYKCQPVNIASRVFQ